MQIEINKGDILAAYGTTIVCPTNYAMFPTDKSKLDYKVFDKAGKEELLKECAQFRGCRVGETKWTSSHKYKKHYENIIFVVGPKHYSYSRIEARKMLEKCYTSILDCAYNHNCSHITLPCLEIGFRGYSRQEQAQIAIETIFAWDKNHNNNNLKVVFYSNDEEQTTLLKKEWEKNINDTEKYQKGIALILAGGGAKGAFQVGAWRALEENNITSKITAIAGTSIGAINAYLFAAPSTYDEKVSLWMNFKQEELTKDKDGKKLAEKIDLLHNSIDGEQWIHRKIFVTISEGKNMLNLNRKYVEISNEPYQVQKEKILGSAAHFFLYQTRKQADGNIYTDGATLNAKPFKKKRENVNVPIQALYDEGYRKFIVLYLQSSETVLKGIKDEIKRYGDADICRVFSEESLDDLKKINETLTKKRISLGYNAMMKQIKDGNLIYWDRFWD